MSMDRESILREAEAAVVAHIRDSPCWQSGPGEPRMIDLSIDDQAADVARVFADLRGEPRPPGRKLRPR